VTARRFPPPWSVEELHACFAVGSRSFYEQSRSRAQTECIFFDPELTMIRRNCAAPPRFPPQKRPAGKIGRFRVGTTIASPQLTKDHRGPKKIED
jgi:hypothetical protein